MFDNETIVLSYENDFVTSNTFDREYIKSTENQEQEKTYQTNSNNSDSQEILKEIVFKQRFI